MLDTVRLAPPRLAPRSAPAACGLRATQHPAALPAALGVGFAVLILAFAPGHHTPDTTYILAQAQGLEPVSDWHQVGYTALQTMLWRLTGSAGMMWAAQVALWIAAVWAFARRLHARQAPAALVLILWPPLALTMAAMWKDNVAVACTLLCLAAAMGPGRSSSVLASLAFGVAASLVRTDYLVIVLPLVALAAVRALPWPLWRSVPAAVLGAAGALVAATLLCQKANPVKVEQPMNAWMSPAVWDIAGVALRDQEPLTRIGEDVVPDAVFARSYDCGFVTPLVFSDPVVPLNVPQEPLVRPMPEEAAALSQAWRDAVTGHPGAYVRHRACTMAAYLGLGPGVVRGYPGWHVTEHPTPVGDAFYAVGAATGQSAMFRLWFYLLAGAVAVAMVRPDRRLASVALYASMAAAAARGLVLPAGDLRYGLWIVAGGLCLLAFLAERYARSGPSAVAHDAA